MASEQPELTYNLPGLGTVRTTLFRNAAAVREFLRPYGHIRRLKTTNQLGVLREAFPGAHHTRYEYLVAQLSLIGGLAEGELLKDRSLGTDRTELGTLPGVSAPSGADLLQVLAILTNAGHLPTTFAGSRSFLHHLRESDPTRRAFRQGLPKEDRGTLDNVLEGFRIYRLHYLVMSFLLGRYRRREHGKEYASFCQGLLREFQKKKSDSDPLGRLFDLYQGIRRLTFLALDSLYAPVPFTLDLGSVFLGLGGETDELFGPRSHFQEALNRFSEVMQDSVYLSDEALLHLAMSSERVSAALERAGGDGEPIRTIGRLWRILAPAPGEAGPGDVKPDVFAYRPGQNESDWAEDRRAKLEYSVDSRHSGDFLDDTVAWETRARARVGKRTGRFGAEWAPGREALRVVGAISAEEDDPVSAARGLAAQLVKLDRRARAEVPSYEPGDRVENGKRMVEFLARSVFGWEHMYRLQDPRISQPSPVIALRGSTKAADRVRKYREEVERQELLEPDDLHEHDVLEKVLRDISYAGLLLAYAGRTIVVDTDDNKEIAEFDGIVFLLRGDPDPGEVLVVEAKNVGHGHTEAKSQLRRQLPKVGWDESALDLMDVGSDGAYAGLKVV